MTDRVRSPDLHLHLPESEPPQLPAPARGAERRLAAGALAAELGHDLQGPLNLFRLNTERLTRGETLDAEDLSLLGEELERLSRLNARLRELARVSGQKVACTPRQLVDLALAGRQATPELELETNDDVSLVCDPTLLSQALRELLDNALEAKHTRAGIRFELGQTPGFCVWDDGAGLTLSTETALGWGVTTRPFAAGLGLTLALRAARAHGFDLELRRIPPRTEAWLLVPARALTAQAVKQVSE
jgi:signal transduction histidine kinase